LFRVFNLLVDMFIKMVMCVFAAYNNRCTWPPAGAIGSCCCKDYIAGWVCVLYP